MRIRFLLAFHGLLLVTFGGLAACGVDEDPGRETEASQRPGVENSRDFEPPDDVEGSTPDYLRSRADAAQGEGGPGPDIGAPLLVFMGTSLTEGYGLADPDSEAWPALVERKARESGMPLEVRNAGLSGETSAGARRRVGWVLDRAPDLFFLETGANDGLRGLDVDSMEENLDAIFRSVREVAPDAHLVLGGMEAPPNLGADYADRFRAVFPRVARRWNATLVPFVLEGVAGNPQLNQADGIHPNPEGHRIMAEEIWSVLGPVIEELRGAPSGRP